MDDNIFFFSTLYDLKNLSYRDAKKQKLSALNVWIPYTFWFDKLSDGLFETDNTACCWRIYCPSMIHKKIGEKRCDIGTINMRYSGYPKMDNFYMEIDERKSQWKCLKADSKKIIYAPGYYFLEDKNNFSTFEMNYMQIYNYAKEHSENTSWIIRPHPILGTTLVKAKIFDDICEYDKYLDMWRKLPNGEVSLGGDYRELFRTSDGLILDSISFVSGYQYINKPLLFLKRREKMDINLYGKKLMETVYQVDGNCHEQIYNFIETVIINGDDKLKQKREEFFERYLDYKKHNGKLSYEYIYDDLSEILGG